MGLSNYFDNWSACCIIRSVLSILLRSTRRKYGKKAKRYNVCQSITSRCNEILKLTSSSTSSIKILHRIIKDDPGVDFSALGLPIVDGIVKSLNFKICDVISNFDQYARQDKHTRDEIVEINTLIQISSNNISTNRDLLWSSIWRGTPSDEEIAFAEDNHPYQYLIRSCRDIIEILEEIDHRIRNSSISQHQDSKRHSTKGNKINRSSRLNKQSLVVNLDKKSFHMYNDEMLDYSNYSFDTRRASTDQVREELERVHWEFSNHPDILALCDFVDDGKHISERTNEEYEARREKQKQLRSLQTLNLAIQDTLSKELRRRLAIRSTNQPS